MIANSGEYRKKNGQRGYVMMNNFIFENKTKVYFGKGGVKEYLGGLLANFGETVMLAPMAAVPSSATACTMRSWAF